MEALVALVNFIRTLADGEYVDNKGQIWLLWSDRSIRLAAYYRNPPMH